MSAAKCRPFVLSADHATQRRAYAVWRAAHKARLAAGDDPVTAIEHAYRIELLFWVLSVVTGRRTP